MNDTPLTSFHEHPSTTGDMATLEAELVQPPTPPRLPLTRTRKAIAAALADPRNRTNRDVAAAAGVAPETVSRLSRNVTVVQEAERIARKRGDTARAIKNLALDRAHDRVSTEERIEILMGTAKIANEIHLASPGDEDNEAERTAMVRSIQHSRVLCAYLILRLAVAAGDGETLLARLQGYLTARGVLGA